MSEKQAKQRLHGKGDAAVSNEVGPAIWAAAELNSPLSGLTINQARWILLCKDGLRLSDLI